MNIPNLISFIAGAVIIVVLVNLIVVLSVRNVKLNSQMKQLTVDKAALLLKLDSLINNPIEKTDGFIRFISESRDWAFEYIEEVQQSIEALRKAIDTDSNEEDIELIYEKLISFLPEKE